MLLVLLTCGCAHVQTTRITPGSLVGHYSTGDAFWPRSLDLRADGTFAYEQLTDLLTLQEDGSVVFENSWGVAGRWSLLPPDRIAMIPDGKPERIEVYIRIHHGDQIVILEPELFPDILETWKSSDSTQYLKQQKPN